MTTVTRERAGAFLWAVVAPFGAFALMIVGLFPLGVSLSPLSEQDLCGRQAAMQVTWCAVVWIVALVVWVTGARLFDRLEKHIGEVCLARIALGIFLWIGVLIGWNPIATWLGRWSLTFSFACR